MNENQYQSYEGVQKPSWKQSRAQKVRNMIS